MGRLALAVASTLTRHSTPNPDPGKIVAGTPEEPWAGEMLQFLMSGDELTESHWCGGAPPEVGKRIKVHSGGELALYGRRPQQRMWARLRSTVEAGGHVIVVSGEVDWQENDSLWIASTGRGGEERRMFAKRLLPSALGGFDTEIALDRPLDVRHIAVTERHGSFALDMYGEVALMDSGGYSQRHPRFNINIEGVDTTHWDYRFRSMGRCLFGALLEVDEGARADL